jgi:hypothetical protein
MKYILSGDYAQYMKYLKNNRISPNEAKYMGTQESWCSERPDKIILIGDWWRSEVMNVDHIRAYLFRLTTAEERKGTVDIGRSGRTPVAYVDGDCFLDPKQWPTKEQRIKSQEEWEQEYLMEFIPREPKRGK